MVMGFLDWTEAIDERNHVLLLAVDTKRLRSTLTVV